jgi:transcription-repair coupling factor (superfamily II helicase)
MIDLPRFVEAARPVTLARCAGGYLPWLMADVARAAKGRAWLIAADEAQARSVAEAAAYFAPEIAITMLPAWDCLPYDRASPSLKAAAERVAALAGLAEPQRGAELVVTTVNAISQRCLPPARIASLSARLKPGSRIDRNSLALKLAANGFVRVDTVVEPGEYALRGGLVDVMPSGEEFALRLDFFGDEIESIRRFDPATQRSLGPADGFDLLPVSEVLLDADRIRAFRSGWLEKFGATATGDPLYEAVSDGRRLAGMEHWLPLFEPDLVTLFDWLAADDVVVRDAGADKAAADRFDAISDYHENRVAALSQKKGSYRPLAPAALYLSREEWAERLIAHAVHGTSSHSVAPGTLFAIDCDAVPARDFAPERVGQANGGPPVYTAIKAHIETRRREGDRVILASYSNGARERLRGLLVDEGIERLVTADHWQEAQGLAASGQIVLTVLPLDHGFTKIDPRGPLTLLTAQGRCLSRRTGDAHAGRSDRPPRSRHRPLRRADGHRHRRQTA